MNVDRYRALQAAREQVALNVCRAPSQSRWVHKKTGHAYVVWMHVILEATLEPAVIYFRHLDDPEEAWCRPAGEFFDGRFQRLDSTS